MATEAFESFRRFGRNWIHALQGVAECCLDREPFGALAAVAGRPAAAPFRPEFSNRFSGGEMVQESNL
ncbi:MAG TPA: hypothetical protein VEJ63_20880 [Planctomycetota bacterium]|nr:hypothetical protein [Planctomycetota bacterium]